MAPAALVTSGVPSMVSSYMSSERTSFSRHVSGVQESRFLPGSGGFRGASGRHAMRNSSTMDSSTISNLVYSLKRRSSIELGSSTSARLLNETYDSIRDWIASQRMSHLPPEGSSYDKVLTWTQLFVERIDDFDSAIQGFAGDSYLAAQLAYGYCAMLLDLGRENAPALMISFGFFYGISMNLVNLLERTELFSVSQEIKEQLVLALSDLVAMVASVATYFHKAIHDTSSASVSVNIYSTFSTQIMAFNERCDNISSAMWQHQLRKENLSVQKVSDVKSIKKWVAPEDRVLTNVAVGLSLLAHDREELTCLWVGPYLTRFLKSEHNVLSIRGKPGSGKSIVASVLVDYLQRPISGIHYNALFIPINSRISSETSSRAIAKSIMCQLFERRIGNVELLQVLLDAYQQCNVAKSNEEYDNIVWGALERAFSATLPGARELIVVVDGIDEAVCGEKALFKKLIKATGNGTKVKLITLGTENHTRAGGSIDVQINDDLIFDDIVAVVRSHFDSDNEFSTLSEFEQESIIARISEASNGSFLWAKLATKRLRREVGLDKFRNAVDSVVKAKPSITEFVSRNLHSSSVTEDTRRMLMWLTIAERPVSMRELGSLLMIQLDHGTLSEKAPDVLTTLKPVQNLVFLQDGLLYIRHGLIRASLHELLMKGQLVPMVKDAHADLVSRLLLYIKIAITEQRKPTITLLDHNEVSQFLHKYQLLDFAIRHWPYHLTQTMVFKNEGNIATAKAFSRFYPISTTALLLQGSLWEHRPKPLLLEYQAAITEIYRHLFTTKSPLTLQSVIFLAILHRQVDLTDKAAQLFFDAAIMSNKLLGADDTLTMQISDWFIEMTESKKTSSKTELMTKREEILTILVECYKSQFGSTSTKAVTVLKRLADHYQMTKEEHKAKQINGSILSITSTQTEGTLVEGEHDLQVQLKQRGDVTEAPNDITLHLDAEEHDELIKHVEMHDIKRTMKRIESAISEHKVEVADRLYVEIWQRTSQEFREHRSDSSIEVHLKTGLGYFNFLQTQKRHAEASATLISIYEDICKSNVAVSQSSVLLLYQVGQNLKSIEHSALALTIFKYCARYSTEASVTKKIQQTIHATTQEVLKSASASQMIVSETRLEEMVLESSSSFTSMDKTSLEVTRTLTSLFISQHRWTDATHFLKKVLRGVWPSLFSASIQDVTLPQSHVEACVELAGRLADCYRTRRRQAKEEEIRVRIYHATRVGCKFDDKLREDSTSNLLAFYSRTSQTDSVIAIRQEILNDCSKHFGDEHPNVIKMLGELAELTRPRHIFVEYYQRMIQIINKTSDVSKVEALQPVIIVAAELWNRGQFDEALPYYRMLFATFFKAPKTGSAFQDYDFVRESFERYTQCLRSVRTSLSEVYTVTTEYHSRCKTLYGASASITIHAILVLARVCQESEAYESQAISLYEELQKMDSAEIDHKEISTILDRIYEEQAATTISSSSKSMSTTQMTKAVTALRKRITTIRKTQSWASEESLYRLTELVNFYNKQQQTDAVIRELKETTVHVLSTETSSVRLMAAASTIASSYIASSQVQKAIELVEEIYQQVFFGGSSSTKQSHIAVSSRSREVLIFLAQLEYSLGQNTTTLTEILASLNKQYLYFNEFNSLIQSKSSTLLDVSIAAARLHHYLLSCGKKHIAASVLTLFDKWFTEVEARRANLKAQTSPQTKLFLSSILKHFQHHKSSDMIRSIGIIGNTQVKTLLNDGQYKEACDLAMTCFKYVSTHKSYRTVTITKLVLTMGMSIGEELAASDMTTRNKLMETSQVIIQDTLHVVAELKINLSQMNLEHLNQLINLLGRQKDYKTLASLFTSLWESRDTQNNWPPYVTFILARRYILARYIVGDTMAALRMTEHIVYNCRRVHGLCHPATLEMSILLSQFYTSIAQKYQQTSTNVQKDSPGVGDMANRYYKKSATIHENVLRVFSDPDYASVAGGALVDSTYGDRRGSMSVVDGSLDSPPLLWNLDDLSLDGHQKEKSDGQRVRQHLHLLKLAVQRLGDWPKGYSEYESLNADIFREYFEDLKGVESIEKWNLKAFGNGKAEADDDLVKSEHIKTWELISDSAREEEEEEL